MLEPSSASLKPSPQPHLFEEVEAVLRGHSEGEVHVDGDPGALHEVQEAALPAVVGRQCHVATLRAAEGDTGAPAAGHGRHQSVYKEKR